MEDTEPIVRRRRERQFRTTEEKRLIVEATRRAGVSVAAVAQAHGVNANQVFYWRKLYDAGHPNIAVPDLVTGVAQIRLKAAQVFECSMAYCDGGFRHVPLLHSIVAPFR